MTPEEAWEWIEHSLKQAYIHGGHPDLPIWTALLHLRGQLNGQKERDRIVNKRLMNEIHDACEDV
jgi:hypothetical protein